MSKNDDQQFEETLERFPQPTGRCDTGGTLQLQDLIVCDSNVQTDDQRKALPLMGSCSEDFNLQLRGRVEFLIKFHVSM